MHLLLRNPVYLLWSLLYSFFNFFCNWSMIHDPIFGVSCHTDLCPVQLVDVNLLTVIVWLDSSCLNLHWPVSTSTVRIWTCSPKQTLKNKSSGLVSTLLCWLPQYQYVKQQMLPYLGQRFTYRQKKKRDGGEREKACGNIWEDNQRWLIWEGFELENWKKITSKGKWILSVVQDTSERLCLVL